MDRFVKSIPFKPIRVLWVSEILLLGLNLFPPFGVGLTNPETYQRVQNPALYGNEGITGG
jgi:hypothetical protein